MREKFKSLEQVKKIREEARAEGKVVVFTNGCFDLIHAGHVDYLEAARAQGEMLIVGLNSDASMRRIKGPERPLMPVEDRAALLAGLAAVDMVVEFDEDDPLELITALMPDVLVKGADWGEGEIIGSDVVTGADGKVVRVELTEGRSTSELINTIVERYGRGRK